MSHYYPLFKHMANEHGLILVDSELQDICEIVDKRRERAGSQEVPCSETELEHFNLLLNKLADALGVATSNEMAWDEEVGCMVTKIMELKAAGGGVSGQCGWAENDDGVYDTACGQCFEFNYGPPKKNHFGFCPFCGKRVAAVPSDRRKEEKP